MSDMGDGAPGTSGGGSRAGLGFALGRGHPGRLSSPVLPPGRLTSLKSRDLTLGGLKKPKKIFEPNVKAVRKSKDELRDDPEEVPKKERRKRDGKQRESRGRRRERPPTIQSHSIFEQGPADTMRKTVWRGTPDLGQAPACPEGKTVKKERRESEQDEDEMLFNLQRDNFIDDPDLRNDARLRPVQLPLYQTHTNFQKTEASTTFKEDPSLPSTESPVLGAGPGGDAPSRGSRMRTVEPPGPGAPTLGRLFHELSLSGREELFFIQLPDCMPGPPPAAEGEADPAGPASAAAENKTPGRRGAQPPPPPKVPPREPRQAALSDFSEGMLGKLLVRRSGRVQLKLGDNIMDVSEGAAFSFLQQLVSVRLCGGRTGDMAVLGNVDRKLVFSPDFQTLLQEAPAQQRAGPR